MLRLLDTVPIDVEPEVPQSVLEQLGGFMAVILHYPGFAIWSHGFLLPIPLWFLIGYADLLILCSFAIGLRRVWKRRSNT